MHSKLVDIRRHVAAMLAGSIVGLYDDQREPDYREHHCDCDCDVLSKLESEKHCDDGVCSVHSHPSQGCESSPS